MSQLRTTPIGRFQNNTIRLQRISTASSFHIQQQKLGPWYLGSLSYIRERSRPKILSGEYQKAAEAMDPDKFSGGAKEVVKHLKKIFTALSRAQQAGSSAQVKRNLGLLRGRAVSRTTELRHFNAFKRQCGSTSYYVALGVILPPEVRGKILETIFYEFQMFSF